MTATYLNEEVFTQYAHVVGQDHENKMKFRCALEQGAYNTTVILSTRNCIMFSMSWKFGIKDLEVIQFPNNQELLNNSRF